MVTSCCEPESDEVKNWKSQIKYRSRLNKKLKTAGKSFISQSESGLVDYITQDNLECILKDIDISHKHLIRTSKTFFSENVLTKLFESERIKIENEALQKENKQLKAEKNRMKLYYDEHIKKNNNISRVELQKCREEVVQLQSYCQYLENDRDETKNRDNAHIQKANSCNKEHIVVNIEGLEVNHRNEKQRFEETLKAQNNLIEDFKSQLKNAKKEKENLKTLHLDLIKQNHELQAAVKNSLVTQNNVQLENEKRKTQEYKQQKEYTDLLVLKNKCEEKNSNLQLMIAKEQANLEKAKNEIAFLKKEIQNQKIIGPLDIEIGMNEETIKENSHPIPPSFTIIKSEIKTENNKFEERDEGVTISKIIKSEAENKIENENNILEENSQQECKVNVDEEDEDPYVQESLKRIDAVSEITKKLEKEVEEFSGTNEDKGYYHLHELLIRNIVKLDNIETEGHLIIRERRRSAIRFIQKVMAALKEKT